jgi:hypothetical protein
LVVPSLEEVWRCCRPAVKDPKKSIRCVYVRTEAIVGCRWIILVSAWSWNGRHDHHWPIAGLPWYVRLNYRMSILTCTIELSHIYLGVYDWTIACLSWCVRLNYRMSTYAGWHVRCLPWCVRLNYRMSISTCTIGLLHVYIDVYDWTIACVPILPH